MQVGPYEIRPHQLRMFEESRKAIADCMRAGDKPYVLVQAPTGAGKTIYSSLVMHEMKPGKRAAFITSGRQLIFQKSGKLSECWLPHSIMMADAYDAADNQYAEVFSKFNTEVHLERLVVSKDTLTSRELSLADMDISLIIIDEAHLATSKQWMDIVDIGIPLIGLSATPATGKGKGLGSFYSRMVYGATYSELIEAGYLVPAKCFIPYSVDLKRKSGEKIKIQANGEYANSHVDEAFNTEDLVGDCVEKWIEFAEDRPTLVYASSVAHAIGLSEEFNRKGIPSAYVEAKTPQSERKEIYDRLQNGELKVVTNMRVLVCLDEETEILTDLGWVGMDDMTYSHRVANWDNGRIWYSKPKNIVRRDRELDERMVFAKGRRVNMRVTENHEILYCTTRGGDMTHKRTAGDAVGKRFQIPVSGHAKPAPQTVHDKIYSEKQIARRITSAAYAMRSRDNSLTKTESRAIAATRLTEHIGMKRKQACDLSLDECAFIGFWCGDGCVGDYGCGKRYSVSQSSSYPAICEWIHKTLNNCGIHWTLSVGSVDGIEAYKWNLSKGTGRGSQKRGGVYGIAPYLVKNGTPLWMGFDDDQFAAFAYGLHLADGDHGNSIESPDIINISSVNFEFLSSVQAVAVCRGWEAKINLGHNRRKPNHNPLHRLHLVRGKDRYFIGNDRLEYEDGWKPEKVWCVTTESGNIITRRGGKVWIMGNCGVDFPCVSCIQFMTSYGSLNSFLQAAGRGLRAYPDKRNCLYIDHGGNIIKHGWPTEDRYWPLAGDEIVERVKPDGEKTKEPPNIAVCPKCYTAKDGPVCPNPDCRYEFKKRGLRLRTVDGSFKEITPEQVKKASKKSDDQKLWGMCLGVMAARGSTVAAAMAMFRNKAGKALPTTVGPQPKPHQMQARVVDAWPGFNRKKKANV